MKSRLLTLVSAVLLSTGVSATPITFDMVWEWKSGILSQPNLTGSLTLDDGLLVPTPPKISLMKNHLDAFLLDFSAVSFFTTPSWGTVLDQNDFNGSEQINLTFNELAGFFNDRTSNIASDVSLEIITSLAGLSYPGPNTLDVSTPFTETFELTVFQARASSASAAIPEPQTLALFGLGLLGLLGRRKHRS